MTFKKAVSSQMNFCPHSSTSYLTTDCQLVSLHWYHVIIWDLWPTFLSLQGNYLQAFVIYSYKCYWPLPALSFSGLSPAVLETTLHCFNWDWVPFLSPLTTSRLGWRYSNTPPQAVNSCPIKLPAYNFSTLTAQKALLPTVLILLHEQQLPSKSQCLHWY
jgi:hypothetical protein